MLAIKYNQEYGLPDNYNRPLEESKELLRKLDFDVSEMQCKALCKDVWKVDDLL